MSKKTKKLSQQEKAEKELNKIKKKRIKRIIAVVITAVIIACVVVAIVLASRQSAISNQLYDTTWIPVSAKNASKDEVDLSEVYQVKYSNFNGHLTFDKEGTFQLWMAPGMPDDGTHSGKFELDKDVIKATFDEGTEAEFYITREDGFIKTINLGYDEYDVYFGASAQNTTQP